jgi:N-acetyl-gamma-glutamyl-phosphate reductase
MQTVHVGIVGAAGYTGGELLRVLLRHPNVRVSFVRSESNAGRPVSHVHTDLVGETDLVFSREISWDVDALFFCLAHGEMKAFINATPIPEHVVLIDLSQDFRYTSPDSWVYGLPELCKEEIIASRSGKRRIANPGCFATCIQLGLLPLAEAGLLPEELHIVGVTGSTGAGQALAPTSHFSWRNDNISVYKAFEHQHVREIQVSLRRLQPTFPENKGIYFIPMRGGFTRGILISAVLRVGESLENLIELYERYFEPHPFVHIVEQSPDVKRVVNTNKCVISLQRHGEMLHIVSVIDNLLKGAAGQALQNMNLAFGLPETSGLMLKASAF